VYADDTEPETIEWIWPMDQKKLQERLRTFADERDWHQFHSPKNLSMALSVEVAELLEHFQWLTEKQSSSPESVDLEEIASEIADIQIYLVMIADKLGVDIEKAVYDKIAVNAVKYPPGVSR
jgi:dCTP diphosphatase